MTGRVQARQDAKARLVTEDKDRHAVVTVLIQLVQLMVRVVPMELPALVHLIIQATDAQLIMLVAAAVPEEGILARGQGLLVPPGLVSALVAVPVPAPVAVPADAPVKVPINIRMLPVVKMLSVTAAAKKNSALSMKMPLPTPDNAASANLSGLKNR
jgi:hypothetical protein